LDAHQATLPEQDYRVLVDWPPEADRPRHFSLCGRTPERGAARTAYFDIEAQQAKREAQNLLYVAMTRARQVLLLSGVEQKRAGDSMYRAVQAGLGDADPSGCWTWGAPPDLTAVRQPVASPVLPPLPPVGVALPVGSRQPYTAYFGQRFGARLQAVIDQLQLKGPAADWASLQKRLRIDTQTLGRLQAQATAFLAAPTLARFFDPSCFRRARNRVNYLAPGGEPQVIDRLVEFDDEVWLLGYGDFASGETPGLQAACAQLAQHCLALAPLRV
jgi:ATP-dependent helicase/nuclease subunit A